MRFISNSLQDFSPGCSRLVRASCVDFHAPCLGLKTEPGRENANVLGIVTASTENHRKEVSRRFLSGAAPVLLGLLGSASGPRCARDLLTLLPPWRLPWPTGQALWRGPWRCQERRSVKRATLAGGRASTGRLQQLNACSVLYSAAPGSAAERRPRRPGGGARPRERFSGDEASQLTGCGRHLVATSTQRRTRRPAPCCPAAAGRLASWCALYSSQSRFVSRLGLRLGAEDLGRRAGVALSVIHGASYHRRPAAATAPPGAAARRTRARNRTALTVSS